MTFLVTIRRRMAGPICSIRRTLGFRSFQVLRHPPRRCSPHPHPGRDYPLGRTPAHRRRTASSPERNPWWTQDVERLRASSPARNPWWTEDVEGPFHVPGGFVMFSTIETDGLTGVALQYTEEEATSTLVAEDGSQEFDVEEEIRGRAHTRRMDVDTASTQAIRERSLDSTAEPDSSFGAPLTRVWRNASPPRKPATLKKRFQKRLSGFFGRS